MKDGAIGWLVALLVIGTLGTGCDEREAGDGEGGGEDDDGLWVPDSYHDDDDYDDDDMDDDDCGGDDDWDDDDWDDDDEECETDHSWPFDPDAEVQDGGVTGFDHLYYPPSPVCLPRDVSKYRRDLRAEEHYEWVKAIAWEYMDEECLVDCTEGTELEECLEADCVAADGTVIEYSYSVSHEVIDDDYDPGSDTVTIEQLIITPPEGAESWSSIFLGTWRNDHQYPGADSGGYEDYQWNTGWEGVLHPALPADELTEINEDYEWSDYSWEGHVYMNNEQMVLYVDDLDTDFFDVDDRVTINGQVVEVALIEGDLFGWVDEELAGQIHPQSWELHDDNLDD